MKVPMKRLTLLPLMAALCSLPAAAAGLDSLEVFVKTVKSGRADFIQVVTGPAKEGQSPRIKTSHGTFEFARPSRFRFNYTKPFAQTIVADGQTLWFYDQDLNQVTARKQSVALGSTPAALIAAAPDLRALQAEFVLSEAGDKDGLQWVLATPKSKDGQLQSVRMGLRVAASDTPTLQTLEIRDSFGQLSVLNFSHFQVNAALPPASFEFKPGPGVDLIRQ